jgi:hypothetical protein
MYNGNTFTDPGEFILCVYCDLSGKMIIFVLVTNWKSLCQKSIGDKHSSKRGSAVGDNNDGIGPS